jgi:GTPase SAR1 family protein
LKVSFFTIYLFYSEPSFESLKKQWIEEYKHFTIPDKVVKVLIGNKSDLTNLKTVQSNVARKFAEDHGMPFYEVSSKDDDDKENIESIFSSIAEKLHKEKPVVLKRASVLNKTSSLQSRDSEKNVTLKNDKEKPEKKKCCGSGS